MNRRYETSRSERHPPRRHRRTQNYQNEHLFVCFTTLKPAGCPSLGEKIRMVESQDCADFSRNQIFSSIRDSQRLSQATTGRTGRTEPAASQHVSGEKILQTTREFTRGISESQDGVGLVFSKCESANRKTASGSVFVNSRSQSAKSQYGAGVPPPDVPLVNVLLYNIRKRTSAVAGARPGART